MAPLWVCSLARLHATAAASKAQSLMTLLSPGGVKAERPPLILSERHLIVGVSDIVMPREGFTQPVSAHVEAMIAFFASWDRRAPLLIHCYAGVSRSTAAAFIGACCLMPDQPEATIAAKLRLASPTATPNPRLIELADTILGRAGRMSRAIADIGRGAECFEGEPFALFLD